MNKSAAITRSLLGWGIVAGPFYLLLGVTQGLFRDGFDFSRHALSHLVNGPWGWVQTLNFILTGSMVIAAAVGIARVLGQERAMCWLLSVFGVGMLLAAFFPADPVDGFPPGTSIGVPGSISTTGLLHFVVAGIGFVSLMASCFAAFFTFKRRGEGSLSSFSIAAGLLIIFGLFGGPMLGSAGIIGIWIAVVTGWIWLGVVSRRMYQISPDPNCE
jgi:hypothetical protein